MNNQNINNKTKENNKSTPLRTKSPKTYSPFLLRIAKGKISHQRVVEVEMSYTLQNFLLKR